MNLLEKDSAKNDWSLKDKDWAFIDQYKNDLGRCYPIIYIETLRQKLIEDMHNLIGIEDSISDITKDLLYQRINKTINKRFGVK